MRLVALEAGIFAQLGATRVHDRFGIDNLFVMGLAGIRLAQIAHPLGLIAFDN